MNLNLSSLGPRKIARLRKILGYQLSPDAEVCITPTVWCTLKILLSAGSEKDKVIFHDLERLVMSYHPIIHTKE